MFPESFKAEETVETNLTSSISKGGTRHLTQLKEDRARDLVSS